eukprot:3729046-Rhodomonas_salina.2
MSVSGGNEPDGSSADRSRIQKRQRGGASWTRSTSGPLALRNQQQGNTAGLNCTEIVLPKS